jgi:nitrate reductase gamma subunit
VNLVLAVLIVVVADAIAIGLLLLIRRRAPEGSYFADGDRASGVFGVLATCFAIFAGFVIFLSFTSYDQSRSGAETEALTVAQQYETAQFLPTRTRLGGQLACYARYVVEQEWPQMESGVRSNTLNPWTVAMFRTIRATDARTSAEQSAFDKWLDQSSDREEARRDRIHGAAGIIPASIWLVLIVTALIVLVYMLFFADSAEMKRSQAMLIGCATTVVVGTILVIYALDNPYRPGLGNIEPTAMERTLSLVDQARAAVGDQSPIPCDDQGNPTS